MAKLHWAGFCSCKTCISNIHVGQNAVNIDTTVQEKNITYPTDAKLAIKIPQGTLTAFSIHLVINRLNKLAKNEGIQQRRTFVKEVKNLRLDLRHFRHVKRVGRLNEPSSD